ncbi:ParB N-terminal domain-containing protein [Neptunicoccus sediminis]|uniref:ParB N-terminal domain-containing protein n=1 Tax=Neptunicoccus sediminis TaxID=1892596 RepID=UPI001FDEBFDF|nr:ParB N-terminal domain-containing protein [Neptunicoccus sediminis]
MRLAGCLITLQSRHGEAPPQTPLGKPEIRAQSAVMPIKETFPIVEIRVPVKRKKTLDPAKVQALAEDILENGQTTPIRVREGKTGGYVLIEGYHRLEALRALGEDTIEGYEVHARLH